MKAASEASFATVLRLKRPSERRRYLKLREENCREKHLAKTHELWVSFLSHYKIGRVWALLLTVLLAQSVVIWSPRSGRAVAAGQRGLWGKADGIALPSAGAADVPQRGPTNPEAEKINRRC